jgi:hypothetical protein
MVDDVIITPGVVALPEVMVSLTEESYSLLKDPPVRNAGQSERNRGAYCLDRRRLL